jgi:iron(III) transport system permease protein
MSGGATNGRATDGRAMSGHVMARRGAAWCVGGTIAALLLPWYAGGGFSAGLAAQIIGGGHAWLWPMLLPLLFVMATLFTRTETIEASGIAADDPESEASHSGTGSDRAARVLIGAAAFGLIWLPLESGLIGAHGWTLPIWHGAWQPSQGSLGWGALVFALLCGTALAHGLARLGYGGGQDFVTVSLLLILGSILVFVAWPILCVLVSAVRDDAGAIDLVLFLNKFTAPSIWSLGCLAGGGCGVAWNSVALAVLVGAVTTLLGLAFALLAVRTALPMKPLLRGLSILPIVTPPFVIGLSLILLFGRAGMVTNWLALHAGIPRSRWIYGMPGIGIAQVLAFTPIAFLILVGMLNGISPTLEEASRTLRASPWRTFRTVTWPLLRPD